MTPKIIAVVGRTGQVAQALSAAPQAPDVTVVTRGRPEADVSVSDTLARFLDDVRPDVVVNAAAYTAVDKAEDEPEAAYAINAEGVANLARACRDRGTPLIHLSTDFVFDGAKGAPYLPGDAVAPLGVYGASKAAGEDALRSILPQHVILRTSWVYSAHGHNFVKTMLRLGAERPEVRVVADQTGAPTHARDLAAAILAVARAVCEPERNPVWGTYHVTGSGSTTWHGLAEDVFRLAETRGLKVPRLTAITTEDYPTPARRPAYSVLDTASFADTFGMVLPDWRLSLQDCIGELITRPDERHVA